MPKREIDSQGDREPKLAGDSERPPIRKLLEKLMAENSEAIRGIGEATGHDAVAYIKALRGKSEDEL